MKKVVNLSPLENMEESLYDLLIMGSIAGVINSGLFILYMYVVFSIFSNLFFIILIGFSISGLLLGRHKKKRFGNKNLSLAERVVKNENDITWLKSVLSGGSNE